MHSAIFAFSIYTLLVTRCASRIGDAIANVDITTQQNIQEVSDLYLSLGMDSNLIRNRWQTFNFSSQRLMTMARGLAPAYLRLCGTDGDRMFFNKTFEKPQKRVAVGSAFPPSNFSMSVADWDNINHFVALAGWRLLFGFNVQIRKWPENTWDSSNAEELLDYSIQQGYYKNLDFELGNEPDLKSGNRWVNINGTTLGKDFLYLKSILDSPQYSTYYANSKLIGPDVAYAMNENFTTAFLNVAGSVVSGVTWHFYYGKAEDHQFANNFTDPYVLDSFLIPLQDELDAISRSKYPLLKSWQGETSSTVGQTTSGIDMSYAAGFMLLDKLGISAAAGIEVFVRQTFFGFDFALVDQALHPTPNYWLSFLYKRLVGRRVLKTMVTPSDPSQNSRATRFYAHCSSTAIYPRGAVTLYGMNLLYENLHVRFSQTYEIDQYLLTPGGYGGITSRFISLNGQILLMPDEENLPQPSANQTASSSITMPPKTMGFYVLKNIQAQACMA